MATNLTAASYEGPLNKRPLPSFIKKLWFILSDAASKEYIFWVDNGQVICVPNAVTFSQTILPRFFKHCNWQSFVRQLNLYGFRKVYQLNLAYDDTHKKTTVWQFKHDSFLRNAPEKLCEIKRRIGKTTANEPRTPPSCLSSKEQLIPASPSVGASSPQTHESASSSSPSSAPTAIQEPNSTTASTNMMEDILSLGSKVGELEEKCQTLQEESHYLQRVQRQQRDVIQALTQSVLGLLEDETELSVNRRRQLISTLNRTLTVHRQQYNEPTAVESQTLTSPTSRLPPPALHSHRQHPHHEQQSPQRLNSNQELPSISDLLGSFSNGMPEGK